MNARQRRRLLRQSARSAHAAAKTLSAAGQRLAERLAYRPREVVVVALLAAGLFGGLAVERWRARHPATADRLETEPVRPTSSAPVQSVSRVRPRSVPARCEEPGARARFGWVQAGSARPRLDLNRATPDELARVAGISWRLAARIVAAREAFEGREYWRTDPDGAGPLSVAEPAGAEPSAPDTRAGDALQATPDAESP
jgi:helix-hairpin-helix protein